MWYRKAAGQGEADAQFSLCDMHFNGKVLPRSYKGAAVCYRKAAGQGYTAAHFSLGAMYGCVHVAGLAALAAGNCMASLIERDVSRE